MEQMKRFAIYYAPRDGAFADAAAHWLGWDARTGKTVAQPKVAGIADLTATPRRYGFHGTIKPPFRLLQGVAADALADAVSTLASRLRAVSVDRLALVRLEGFLAMIPQGDTTELAALATRVVQGLEPFRAPLTPAEIARRRPEALTARQRVLLDKYGYPYVLEQFQFHLTLSDRLEGPHVTAFETAARTCFNSLLPQPFVLQDLCLFGEDQDNRFHLLHRYPLIA
jgi:putative phosphonate metabolism protein